MEGRDARRAQGVDRCQPMEGGCGSGNSYHYNVSAPYATSALYLPFTLHQLLACPGRVRGRFQSATHTATCSGHILPHLPARSHALFSLLLSHPAAAVAES